MFILLVLAGSFIYYRVIWYLLCVNWASLVAQLVKNTPAMRETWFDPWVGKIPWGRERLTHSSTLAWRIPWTVQSRVTESDTTELTFTSLCVNYSNSLWR